MERETIKQLINSTVTSKTEPSSITPGSLGGTLGFMVDGLATTEEVNEATNISNASYYPLPEGVTELPVPPLTPQGQPMEVAWTFLEQEVTYTQSGGAPITGVKGRENKGQWNGTTWSLKDMGDLPSIPIADDFGESPEEAATQRLVTVVKENQFSFKNKIEGELAELTFSSVVPSIENAGRYYNKNTGALHELSGYKAFLFPIDPLLSYYCTTRFSGTSVAMAVFFDEDMNYLGNQNPATVSGVTYTYDREPLNPLNNARYVGITSNSGGTLILESAEADFSYVPSSIEALGEGLNDLDSSLLGVSNNSTINTNSILKIEKGLGTFEELTTGVYTAGTYYDKNTGELKNNGGYRTKIYTVDLANRLYCTTSFSGASVAMAVFFDENMNFLGNQNPATEGGVNYVFEEEEVKPILGTKYIGITRQSAGDFGLFEVVSYSYPVPPTEFKETSPLNGKRIAVVGDSITEANSAEVIEASDQFYPLFGVGRKNFMYYIAKRNGSEWFNYGKSGSTLGYCFAEGLDRNGFAKPGGRYTSMDANIDYFVIMFGTNDSAYGRYMWAEKYVEGEYGSYYKYPRTSDLIGQEGFMTQAMVDDLNAQSEVIEGTTYTGMNLMLKRYKGSIDSSDVETWCGAWNVVLEYIIKNYPLAKILVWFCPTNGIFTDETKQMCLRWGLPWLDMHEENAPLIWTKPGMVAGATVDGIAISTYRRNTYTYDGTHPNDDGYQQMSTIIENALKSI